MKCDYCKKEMPMVSCPDKKEGCCVMHYRCNCRDFITYGQKYDFNLDDITKEIEVEEFYFNPKGEFADIVSNLLVAAQLDTKKQIKNSLKENPNTIFLSSNGLYDQEGITVHMTEQQLLELKSSTIPKSVLKEWIEKQQIDYGKIVKDADKESIAKFTFTGYWHAMEELKKFIEDYGVKQ